MKNITSVNTNMPLFIAAEIRSKENFEGIWITLPISKEHFCEAAGLICESWDDIEISYYSTSIPELSIVTMMDTPFAVLNHLAARLQGLDAEQTLKLTAIMTSWHRFSTPEQIIRYTYNTDKYTFIPGISTQYELGKHRVAELDTSCLPPVIASCISVESLGMQAYHMENGRFVALGYISSNGVWGKPAKKRRIPAYLDIRNENTGEELYGSWHYFDYSVEHEEKEELEDSEEA